ncbi:MAG: Ig-like domain-containing protein, partial [Pseudomonadales bacterium]|nr:Ig-like domain-containing protein [Pseudomonadales bacterium]NRA15276.1 hypothetical protein [Oceanospirillaceae bacterium]
MLYIHTGNNSQFLDQGQTHKVQTQTNEQYKVSYDNQGQQLVKGASVGWVNHDLLLQYPDGTQIVLQEFMLNCQGDDHCSVSLPDITLSTSNTISDNRDVTEDSDEDLKLLGELLYNPEQIKIDGIHLQLDEAASLQDPIVMQRLMELGIEVADQQIAETEVFIGGDDDDLFIAELQEVVETIPQPRLDITLANSALKIGDSTLVTFSFSAVPVGFSVTDISIANGSLSGFTVTGDDQVYTATFTPDAGVEAATNAISVGSNWTNISGNQGAATSSSNYSIDTLAPTLAISLTDSDLLVGETAVVTFSFSEVPIGFNIADINVENGSLSGFSVTADPRVYTATLSPDNNIDDGSNIISVTASYSDAAGNLGSAASSANYSINTVTPTVIVTMADTDLAIGESSLVTFTFSEDPLGFTSADISVDNGSVSGFTVTADPAVYTATFTANANVEDSSNLITVGTGYTNTAGNSGIGASSANYSIDTIAPTVAITMADSALQIGETSLVTFTFSETPIGFTQGDVNVENGSLSGFTVTADDKVYTATFTPAANTEDSSNIVSVGTGYTDAAGNTGTAATSANYSIDTTAPTVAITMADTALQIGETSLVTFTFDETPTGFTQGDVSVENGSLSGFTVTADDKVYTATFTPTANIEDSSNIVSVGTGYTDAAGNTGTANTSANYTIDTTAPTVAITMADTALNIGETSLVTFTFDETPTGF